MKMDDVEGFSIVDADHEHDKIKNKKLNKNTGGFQSFGLSPIVLKGVQKRGYKVPTPIQRKAIPLILQGRDVVAMARTGSGKTACFLLPMFERLKKKAPKSQFGVRALVLSPTRELALQTVRFIKELGRFTELKALALLGGDSMDYQFDALHKNPDIIVATPGRFLHLCIEMDLKLNSIEYVVFDEADRLFEMGFGEQLKEILDRLGDSRQTVLFSATLPKLLVDFAKAGLTNPILLRLDVESKLPETLELAFFSVNQDEKVAALLCILQSLPRKSQTLVFVATKHHVEYLHMILNKAHISNTYIYSDLDPSARKINAGKFQNRKCSVLVVTDVAARGVDIPHLDYVINFHFPAKAKLFVHRVGRCARAGKTGTAFSIVSLEEAPFVLDLHLFLAKNLNLVPINCNNKNISSSGAFGKIPSRLIEIQQCEILSWLKNNEELISMEKVSSNGYKKYLKSRPGASLESIKRLKKLNLKNIGTHPFFYSQDNEEVKIVEILEKMKEYKPKGTVFELNISNKSKCYMVMKNTKKKHEQQVVNFRRKIEENRIGFLRNADEEKEEKENLKESNEEDIKSTFCDVIGKKRKNNFNDVGCKKLKKKFVDEEYYVPHFAPDQHTEKGLAINNFTSEANKATFDLAGDCDEGLKMQKQLKKWDKKKKKMVNVPGQNVGKIKTESGNWISASYKSNRYAQWKEKSKIDKSDDEDDGDENKIDEFKSKIKKSDFPNTRWGRHNRKIAEKLKAKVKLKRPEQIFKQRQELERKRQKSIPKNKRGKFSTKKKNK